MEPFGDDEEDFEMNVMLNANLDVGCRSAISHQMLYPKLLTCPVIPYNKLGRWPEDNLHAYLKSVSRDAKSVGIQVNDV